MPRAQRRARPERGVGAEREVGARTPILQSAQAGLRRAAVQCGVRGQACEGRPTSL